MKAKSLFIVILGFLVLSLAGVSYGWQGRMAGMGDPYGLVQDESDYLVHPAKIANGEGIRFYGDYRFTYTGVLKWDNEVNIFTPAGVPAFNFPKETSGDELRHEALVGSSFPLGPGRMGLFFTYSGMRGDYDGKLNEWALPSPAPTYFDTYDLKSDLDNFALRLLYGLPLGSFKLGGEFQLAYRQEKNKALYNEDYGGGNRVLWINFPWGGIWAYENPFPLMVPYDSRYWEALFKGSLEGKMGPLDLEVTLRGGFLFGGDNTYTYEVQRWIGNPVNSFDLKGDVTGWRIGGDLWARYPLANGLSLPFLVRVDYQEKTRDGDGPGQLGYNGFSFTYKNQEKSLGITVGGGVDKELSKGAKIAAGIYYNYLQGKNDVFFYDVLPPSAGGGREENDYSPFPDSTEHQIMLRLAGERSISPAVTLRMGLAPFYGWVKENFKSSWISSSGMGYTDDVPTDGYHWGIKASVGGTIKFKPITLEPFINGGYQRLHLKGDGDRAGWGGESSYLYEMSKDRNEWSIGGGFSIKFN
jgi:hypothetical protein